MLGAAASLMAFALSPAVSGSQILPSDIPNICVPRRRLSSTGDALCPYLAPPIAGAIAQRYGLTTNHDDWWLHIPTWGAAVVDAY